MLLGLKRIITFYVGFEVLKAVVEEFYLLGYNAV
jgi:hypothetical protein